MSLKDQGNQLFRQGRYEEAIKCYEEYLEYDPCADKKTAYCNISFCHFKLRDYRDSIESADDCINEDPTYHKAYYRKLHAFKELPGHDYDVFINATLLLRHWSKIDPKDKYDYQQLINTYKSKWTQQAPQKQPLVQETDPIFETNHSEMEIEGPKSAAEWVTQWDQHENKASQWSEIEEVTKQRGETGLHLAFLFLNHLSTSDPFFSQAKQKINILRASIEGQIEINGDEAVDARQGEGKEEVWKSQEEPLQQGKQSSSSEQNLFDNEAERKSEPPSRPSPSTTPQASPDPTEKEQLKRKEEDVPPVLDNGKPHLNDPSIQERERQMLGQSRCPLEEHFQRYVESVQKARDQISELLAIVEGVLASDFEGLVKDKLLTMISVKFKKQVQLMRTSFSKKEQKKVFDLLVANKMEKFVPEFASRHATQ